MREQQGTEDSGGEAEPLFDRSIVCRRQGGTRGEVEHGFERLGRRGRTDEAEEADTLGSVHRRDHQLHEGHPSSGGKAATIAPSIAISSSSLNSRRSKGRMTSSSSAIWAKSAATN